MHSLQRHAYTKDSFFKPFLTHSLASLLFVFLRVSSFDTIFLSSFFLIFLFLCTVIKGMIYIMNSLHTKPCAALCLTGDLGYLL